MTFWHLYPTLSAPMPFQLALDEILFRQMEQATNHGPQAASPEHEVPMSRCPMLRFYFSSEPWITVGYSYRNHVAQFQYPHDKTCRRMTGGGRVLHGKDLIFSLAARKEADESFKSVRLSYLKIHEAVKAGFEALGRTPTFYRCDEDLARGGDCFRFPIATDLALGRRKIAGGAQKRSAGTLLHQGSLKPIGVSTEDLTRSLEKSFEKIFSVKLQPADLQPQWLEAADQMAKEKYSPLRSSSPLGGRGKAGGFVSSGR